MPAAVLGGALTAAALAGLVVVVAADWLYRRLSP